MLDLSLFHRISLFCVPVLLALVYHFHQKHSFNFLFFHISDKSTVFFIYPCFYYLWFSGQIRFFCVFLLRFLPAFLEKNCVISLISCESQFLHAKKPLLYAKQRLLYPYLSVYSENARINFSNSCMACCGLMFSPEVNHLRSSATIPPA